MSIVRVSKRTRYVVIDKTGIEDPRLSFKATGLLAFLLGKPDQWTINYRGLIKQKTDKQHSVLGGLKELETCGYLRRERKKTRDGTWTWEQVLHEVPCVGNPLTVFPHALEDHARKTHAPSEEPLSETSPLPPAKQGEKPRNPNPRSKGTNPRAVAKAQKIADLERELAECPSCGTENWDCTNCARRLRELKEAS